MESRGDDGARHRGAAGAIHSVRRRHRCFRRQPDGPTAPLGAVCLRGTGLALAERVGVIEIDLPDGVRGVDSSVNEKALRRPVLVGAATARMIVLPPGTKVFLACLPVCGGGSVAPLDAGSRWA